MLNASFPVLAAGAWYWSWLSYFDGAGSRAHVVQFCIVLMCLALFIMLRKFGGLPPRDGR